jgi:hypothetical protein
MKMPMSPQKAAILLLLVLVIAVSGCCCCSNYVPGNILPPSVTPEVDRSSSDAGIIGTWSSEGPYGTLVDPATGGVSGSVYNGEWYIFKNDGTYRYIIMSSGIALSGGVVREGKYSIDGGEVVLYGNLESWYPDLSRSGQKPAYRNQAAEDERHTYEIQDEDTISIDGHSFYRISTR